MIRRPPRSTPFPTRRSSDLLGVDAQDLDLPVPLDRRADCEALQLLTERGLIEQGDRKSTRLNSSHGYISYAGFCLEKKKKVTKLSTVGTRCWSWPACRCADL